jgi:hypothetical protein
MGSFAGATGLGRAGGVTTDGVGSGDTEVALRKMSGTTIIGRWSAQVSSECVRR